MVRLNTTDSSIGRDKNLIRLSATSLGKLIKKTLLHLQSDCPVYTIAAEDYFRNVSCKMTKDAKQVIQHLKRLKLIESSWDRKHYLTRKGRKTSLQLRLKNKRRNQNHLASLSLQIPFVDLDNSDDKLGDQNPSVKVAVDRRKFGEPVIIREDNHLMPNSDCMRSIKKMRREKDTDSWNLFCQILILGMVSIAVLLSIFSCSIAMSQL